MAQYQIFLLPLLALLIAILFPIFDKGTRQSSSLKSRRRRRILIGRFTVIALLLATVITEIWPTKGLMPLFQGALVTVLLLLPVCIVLWLFTRRLDSKRAAMPVKAGNTSGDTTAVAAENPAVPMPAKSVDNLPRIPDLAPVSQKTAVSRGTEHPATLQPAALQPAALKLAAVKPVAPKPAAPKLVAPLSAPEPDEEVQEHLGRVSNFIQSYDLDEPGFTSPEEKNLNDVTQKNRDKLVSDTTALVATSGHTTDLAKLDTNQITQLVTTLRKDKKRLQKLVIAQQAAIQTERHAHEKTRVLTRDAISVMRSARTAQKHAEKLARRERSERQRLEQQYKKVAYELSNALSIVEERKVVEASNESVSLLETAQMSDKILF